jgi:hypothetical protein
MLHPTPASEGLLFASFLFREDLHKDFDLQSVWENDFGKSFSLKPLINPLNNYYEKEMGPNLSRIFFVTTETYPREFLLSAKLLSLEWERNWAIDNKRMVNVDIGFLSLENFLLATTKNYSHRVYLGQNIFADLTYQFVQGEFKTLPWTYPDYVDQSKIEFLSWCRSYLLQKNTTALKDVSLIKK